MSEEEEECTEEKKNEENFAVAFLRLSLWSNLSKSEESRVEEYLSHPRG